MRDHDPQKHSESLKTGDWRWAEMPPPGDLPYPRHPDGDLKYVGFPKRKVNNSKAIIEHIKKSGAVHIGTGSTKPDYAGKTDGSYVNFAKPTDAYYTISRDNGAHNLTLTTGYNAPYGKKVRIGDWMFVQGWPMNEYSDHKLHIIDPTDRTVTEIQGITEARRNPFVTWLLGLFGQTPGFHCHGVSQYSLDVPSTDPSVEGSSAARWPLVGAGYSYQGFAQHFTTLGSVAVPAARKGRFVPPALNSDGPSEDIDSVMMGQVLKMSEEAFTRLYNDPDSGRQARYFFCCWYLHGLVVIDTGDNTSWGPDLDPRWNQVDLQLAFQKVKMDDFEVWEF